MSDTSDAKLADLLAEARRGDDAPWTLNVTASMDSDKAEEYRELFEAVLEDDERDLYEILHNVGDVEIQVQIDDLPPEAYYRQQNRSGGEEPE